MKNNYLGRSMIEMLGVLAIIAVLSVGGIAGYSKAMTKWKINKAMSEYNFLIFGIMQHLDDFRDMGVNGKNIWAGDAAKSLGLIPNNWKTDGNGLHDAYGNTIGLYLRGRQFLFNIFVGGSTLYSKNKKYKEQFCLELFQQVFVPLHSFATYGQVWHGQDTSFTYWGDAGCKSKNQKCLSNISLDDIYQACHSCATISEAYCNVNLSF